MNTYGFFLTNIWLILLIPLLSFIIVGLFIGPKNKKLAGIFATTSIFVCAALAYGATFEYLSLFPLGAEHPVIVPWSVQWMPYLENLTATLGIMVDPLSCYL